MISVDRKITNFSLINNTVYTTVDRKITNFSLINTVYTCLLTFLRDHHNYLLVHAKLLTSGESISQYTTCSPIFSLLHSVINEEKQ